MLAVDACTCCYCLCLLLLLELLVLCRWFCLLLLLFVLAVACTLYLLRLVFVATYIAANVLICDGCAPRVLKILNTIELSTRLYLYDVESLAAVVLKFY